MVGDRVLCNLLPWGGKRIHASPDACYNYPPLQRQLVVQETARWRKKELVASIPRSARFEMVRCDSDMNLYEVRIKSTDKGWVMVAEYVSKENAERMARDANSRLL
jgi:hypothetical protein